MKKLINCIGVCLLGVFSSWGGEGDENGLSQNQGVYFITSTTKNPEQLNFWPISTELLKCLSKPCPYYIHIGEQESFNKFFQERLYTLWEPKNKDFFAQIIVYSAKKNFSIDCNDKIVPYILLCGFYNIFPNHKTEELDGYIYAKTLKYMEDLKQATSSSEKIKDDTSSSEKVKDDTSLSEKVKQAISTLNEVQEVVIQKSEQALNKGDEKKIQEMAFIVANLKIIMLGFENLQEKIPFLEKEEEDIPIKIEIEEDDVPIKKDIKEEDIKKCILNQVINDLTSTQEETYASYIDDGMFELKQALFNLYDLQEEDQIVDSEEDQIVD